MSDTTKIEMELLGYLNRGLVNLHEWVTLRQIELYARDPMLKELLTWAAFETTRRPSRCTACGEHLKCVSRSRALQLSWPILASYPADLTSRSGSIPT